jgi:sec-independent protein translocase protein TatA
MLSGLENPVHLLMIFGVVLLLFGAKRIPEIGKSLGTGLREFKSSITSGSEAVEQALPAKAESSTSSN